MATTLTDRQIRAAKCPDDLNQFDLRDDQPRGLVLRVYTSGVKTWFLFYRRKEDNRRRYLKLDTYPALSLKKARERAEVELGRVAAGEDPQADGDAPEEDSGAPTMGEVTKMYLELYAKVHKRPKSYQMDVWQAEAYVVPHWGEVPIDEITQEDIRDLLQGVASGELAAKGKPTKVAPRNLRALLSKIFDWAADQGHLAGNPAVGVKLPVRVRCKHLKKGGRDRGNRAKTDRAQHARPGASQGRPPRRGQPVRLHGSQRGQAFRGLAERVGPDPNPCGFGRRAHPRPTPQLRLGGSRKGPVSAHDRGLAGPQPGGDHGALCAPGQRSAAEGHRGDRPRDRRGTERRRSPTRDGGAVEAAR